MESARIHASYRHNPGVASRAAVGSLSYNLHMTVLQAHFDGKVFVPDEPLDLPPGTVTLQIIELDMDTHPLSRLPILRAGPQAKTITLEDVRQAMQEDD
jgi:hypothetical protein